MAHGFEHRSGGVFPGRVRDQLAPVREEQVSQAAGRVPGHQPVDDQDAKEHEEEDKKRKEEVEVRNNADSLAYASEKTLSEIGDKLSKEQKEKIEFAMKELKESLEGTDTANIKEKTESLQKVIGDAGASIYQKAAAEQAAKQQAGPGGEEKGEGKPRKKRKSARH